MKQLFKEVTFFTQNHLAAIARIVLPYILLTVVIDIIFQRTGLPENTAIFLSMFIGFSIQTFYIIAVIKYLHRSAQDDASLQISVSAQEWRSLFLARLLYGLAVVAGLFLFIIPGVIIYVRCYLVDFCVVLEKRSAFEALQESWGKTQNYIVEITVMLFILLGFGVVLSPLLQYLASMGIVGDVLRVILTLMIQIPLLIFATVFFFRVYTLAQAESDNNKSE